MSAAYVETPTYADACNQLHLNPANPGPKDGNSDEPFFVLKPWQVMGAAWMCNQESGPIKGGLVSDDCGVGKTLQALYAIYVKARQTITLAEAGVLTGPYKPTLVVVPNGVLET